MSAGPSAWSQCGQAASVASMIGQCAGHAGPARAGLLAGVWQVRLLTLRGRQAGVVRGLGRGGEPAFQLGDARGQRRNLLRLRLDQGNQVVAGNSAKGGAVHACS
jgi:hypothetical protein